MKIIDYLYLNTLNYLSYFIGFLWLLALFFISSVVPSSAPIYSFKIKDIDGHEVDFSKYKGKILVIVNVASNSPLTTQYESLEQFYQKYKGKGVEVLAFPSNSFNSELETDKEIRVFCRSKYRISFSLFTKVDVKGKKQHPIFKYLANKSENEVMDAPIKWDFQKFIINKKGMLVTTISPTVEINDAKVIAIIDELIRK